MIVIEGTIKTEAPLSIAMPVATGSRANEFSNFPLMTRGIDEDGNKLQTAYLPATTLRGFLRRAIVLPDMQAAADEGNHYKLPQAYAELIGQDAASEQKSGEIDLLALKETRESSPVLDLFGSGLGVKSRLMVSHFLPEQNVLPDAITGTRKDLDDNEETFNLIAEEEKQEFFDRSNSNTKRAQASALVTNLKRQQRAATRKNEATEELDAQLVEAEKLEAKYKQEMGDMKNSSRTILEHHVMGAGISLKGKFVIENEKDRDIDLIVLGLNSLSLCPILGAQSARGCGEISATFDFMKDGILFKKVTVGGFSPAKVDDF